MSICLAVCSSTLVDLTSLSQRIMVDCCTIDLAVHDQLNVLETLVSTSDKLGVGALQTYIVFPADAKSKKDPLIDTST